MPKPADIYRTPKGRKVLAAALAGTAAVLTGGATLAPDAVMGLLGALAAFFGG